MKISENIKNKCGVYKITCTANGCVYIGTSNHVKFRIKTHLSSLKRNVGISQIMQHDFNLFGSDNFTAEELEYCLINEKFKIEAFYIKKHETNCYNLANTNKPRPQAKRAKRVGRGYCFG